MNLTTTPAASYAAASMLMHSLSRGDFDEDPDFDNEAAYACGLLVTAADAATKANENTCTTNLDGPVLDEILAVLETENTPPGAPLADFITAANAAFEQASTPADR